MPPAGCRRALLLAAGLAICLVPAQASAQAVRGAIRDQDTGAPLAGGRAYLLDVGGDTLARVLARTDGTFLAGADTEGEYIVVVMRLGYRRLVHGPLWLGLGDTLDMAYDLPGAAIQLDAVVVEAVAMERRLQRAGFFERARMGWGHHMEPDRVAARRPTASRIGDYLVGVPGVMVLGREIRLTGTLTGTSDRCAMPRFFVDDVPLYLEPGDSIDDIVSTMDVQAIEVYRRPVETPMRYGGPQSCGGVILIWTRFGEP